MLVVELIRPLTITTHPPPPHLHRVRRNNDRTMNAHIRLRAKLHARRCWLNVLYFSLAVIINMYWIVGMVRVAVHDYDTRFKWVRQDGGAWLGRYTFRLFL